MDAYRQENVKRFATDEDSALARRIRCVEMMSVEGGMMMNVSLGARGRLEPLGRCLAAPPAVPYLHLLSFITSCIAQCP